MDLEVPSDPWVVRAAKKFAEKNPDLVIAKGQKTCLVLLILNLLAATVDFWMRWWFF